MTGMCLVFACFLTNLQSLYPSSRGMLMSDNIMAGLHSDILTNASTPSCAWTTLKPSRSNVIINSFRIVGLSSTVKMVSFSPAARGILNRRGCGLVLVFTRKCSNMHFVSKLFSFSNDRSFLLFFCNSLRPRHCLSVSCSACRSCFCCLFVCLLGKRHGCSDSFSSFFFFLLGFGFSFR